MHKSKYGNCPLCKSPMAMQSTKLYKRVYKHSNLEAYLIGNGGYARQEMDVYKVNYICTKCGFQKAEYEDKNGHKVKWEKVELQ